MMIMGFMCLSAGRRCAMTEHTIVGHLVHEDVWQLYRLAVARAEAAEALPDLVDATYDESDDEATRLALDIACAKWRTACAAHLKAERGGE